MASNGEAVAVVAIIVTAIIVGLIMRFGATSVPIANDLTSVVGTGFSALTLQGSGYPYEGPSSSG